MDRMRQEASEAGLKEGLKKALQMLDTIRARYVHIYAVLVFIVTEPSTRKCRMLRDICQQICDFIYCRFFTWQFSFLGNSSL